MRAGLGEFFEPGSDAEPTWVARQWFLAAVERLAPEVLDGLRHDVLPVYRDVNEGAGSHEAVIEADDETPWLEIVQEPRYAAWAPLIDALVKWAQPYHLDANWIIYRALLTLQHWGESGQVSGWQHAPRSGSLPLLEGELHYQFRHLAWVPLMWTRSHYEGMVRKAFEQHLTAYLDNLETAAIERGLKRTPEWRTRDQSPGRHFEWLVRWQVQRWTLQQIANPESVGRQTVRDALQNTAAAIDLPLRKGKPGRPPRGLPRP
jgi:hypothetical protein